MMAKAAVYMQVSLQSIIMDIGHSDPGSPASMSVDFASAAPGLNPAAFLAGSSVSSTEQSYHVPQVGISAPSAPSLLPRL